ncbi:MAG: hypothetical protein COA69_05035 [Robiginitomaculum sp.]|nr:MAG: hypothetical protein COA69_05035 [Robiginitomaculum sp.]
MKKIFITFVSVLSVFSAQASFADDVPAPMDFGPRENLTIVSAETQHVFSVEIADTQAERNRGLMFRDMIPADEGMLFEFEARQVASIWMKNTSVFLDVLFVRADGSILKIEHSAKPYSLRSMTSEAPVVAVLELAGGRVNALGIKAGDRIEHSFFTAK